MAIDDADERNGDPGRRGRRLCCITDPVREEEDQTRDVSHSTSTGAEGVGAAAPGRR